MTQGYRITIAAVFTILAAFSVYNVHAADCAAEANFQGCKTMEQNRLKDCGLTDYACQCAAQKLIQECFNLCPVYANDAAIQAGTVEAICAAVPVTTSASVTPLTTSAAAVQSTTQSSSSSTAAKPSATQTTSSASSYSPLQPTYLLFFTLAALLFNIMECQ
ncbi:hypothetical protein EC973_001405 [Apophysomyces ossiformis]|uniref:Uncharacterized protein n=1 Tax=Apophysomyces ossiformis TaxID=679940 RepID=A0A8H7BQB3_9FUNG|nr:hypothetical protein EC973_001405 [Apophysomyces ossiformis]